ncbi:MAG: hypothetical protein WBA15_12475 [Mesorhizobium sp.]
MIKLDSLSRWRALEAGSVLTLPGGKVERRIRLQVNSPGRAALYVVGDGGEMSFLAAPDGRDVVEFSAAGDVRLTTTAQDVFCHVAELEPTSFVVEDAETYTKVMQRRSRNPELEQMMFLMNLNMDRRLAAQAAQFEERLKANGTAIHVGAPAEPAESDEGDAGAAPPEGDEAGRENSSVDSETIQRETGSNEEA